MNPPEHDGMYAEKSLKELRGLSEDELIRRHDSISKSRPVTLEYYLTELARRDAEEREKRMLLLTWVIAGLTLVNAVFVGVTVF